MATIRATKQIPLDSIQPHPENPNQGDVGAITQSLKHHGQYRAIVVSEATGNIVAGNHTYLAAKANGEAKILAHLIPGLSLEDEKRIMVADNQYARLATSDDALLVDLLTELAESQDGLIATGYDGDDLDQLIADLQPFEDKTGREGEVGEPPADPTTKPGDRWQLGPHTLVCGDALDANSYPQTAALMFADPPYNVGIEYEDTDDTRSDADYRKWLTDWYNTAQQFTPRSIVTPGWHNWVWFAATVGYYAAAVWIKRNSTVHGKISMWTLWEPLMFIGEGWKKAGTQRNFDEFDYPMQHPNMGDDHPVPKPLNLIEDLLSHYSQVGDLIVDPFGGSGTTLIAATNTDRVCHMIELSPAYCDVIIKRWESLSPDHHANLMG